MSANSKKVFHDTSLQFPSPAGKIAKMRTVIREAPSHKQTSAVVMEIVATIMRMTKKPMSSNVKSSTNSNAKPSTNSNARPKTNSNASPPTDRNVKPSMMKSAKPFTTTSARRLSAIRYDSYIALDQVQS